MSYANSGPTHYSTEDFACLRSIPNCEIYTASDPMAAKLIAQQSKLNKKPKFIKGIPPDLLNAGDGCRFIDRCPEAMEKCKQTPPKINTKSGYVLCWLHE